MTSGLAVQGGLGPASPERVRVAPAIDHPPAPLFMRRFVRVLTAYAVVSAVVPTVVPVAAAEAQQPVPVIPVVPAAYVAVTGVGEVEVTPDRARLSIGVRTQAATAADASARNARLQRAVIDTLRSLGIAQEQITTSGYNVYPEQTYEPQTRRSRITGYNVVNTVVVDIRRIDQVGPTLDAVLARGANLVSSLQFYSSQAEANHRRALQNAITRARADAEAMAAAAGGRLGELAQLDAHGGFAPRPVEAMVMMDARAAAAPPPPTEISQGTQTITASVNARWRFVPNQ